MLKRQSKTLKSSEDVSEYSHKKVWWKCDKGEDHEWESNINNRTNGKGCPICRGLKVVSSNCLATLNPELAKGWHLTKNIKLTPFDVTKHIEKGGVVLLRM